MQRLRAWSGRATKRRESTARQDASSYDANSQGTKLQEDPPPPYNTLSPATAHSTSLPATAAQRKPRLFRRNKAGPADTARTCCPSCDTNLQLLATAEAAIAAAKAKAAITTAAYFAAHDSASKITRAILSTSDTEVFDQLTQLVHKAAEQGIAKAQKVLRDGKPATTTTTTPAAERAAIVASYEAAERGALGVAHALISNEHYTLSPVVTVNLLEAIIKGAQIYGA